MSKGQWKEDSLARLWMLSLLLPVAVAGVGKGAAEEAAELVGKEAAAAKASSAAAAEVGKTETAAVAAEATAGAALRILLPSWAAAR